MIELSDIEIDAVDGGLSAWGIFVTVGNAVIDFFTGFYDGVNAATQ